MRKLSDLHRHLDGSLRAGTLRELSGAEAPRFRVGMGLQAALDCFAVTLAALRSPDAVKRVASEICIDAAAEGVTTLEIRFAPQLHKGAPMEDIVDAAIDGVRGRAGVILCALYGEPPSLTRRLVDIAARRQAVVGIDIAGGPQSGDDFSLGDYAEAFGAARDAGLGRTVHAGEGRPPEEIRTAIEVLHAQRIGHGTTLLDDLSVLDLVLEKNVTIEACPTSNVHTGIIDSVADHPIAAWLERGVAVCVNTDNTLLSDIDAPSELANVAAIDAISESHVDRIVAAGHAARFQR